MAVTGETPRKLYHQLRNTAQDNCVFCCKFIKTGSGNARGKRCLNSWKEKEVLNHINNTLFNLTDQNPGTASSLWACISCFRSLNTYCKVADKLKAVQKEAEECLDFLRPGAKLFINRHTFTNVKRALPVSVAVLPVDPVPSAKAGLTPRSKLPRLISNARGISSSPSLIPIPVAYLSPKTPSTVIHSQVSS